MFEVALELWCEGDGYGMSDVVEIGSRRKRPHPHAEGVCRCVRTHASKRGVIPYTKMHYE